MIDHTGRAIDELSLRDLCDLVEFRLFEHADEKGRRSLREKLAAEARRWELSWAVKHPLPVSAIAATMRRAPRALAPPRADGMAVGQAGGD